MLERSEFGPFTIDHRAFELRRNGQRVRISASLLKLLVLFVERPGELITRDQIIACLWDQPESVDVDTGINTALSRLRLILRDHSGKRVYLETVVGAGYRFKMPVKRFPETTAADSPVELLHALPRCLQRRRAAAGKGSGNTRRVVRRRQSECDSFLREFRGSAGDRKPGHWWARPHPSFASACSVRVAGGCFSRRLAPASWQTSGRRDAEHGGLILGSYL